MATRTGRLVMDQRTGKMVEEFKEDQMAVAVFNPEVRPQDHKFQFVLRSDFTVPKINKLFSCNAALLKDPFGNVLWPKDWMTQVLPPKGADRWFYLIHERLEPPPRDDLLDPLYSGGALLVLAFVPAQCEPVDLRTWLLFGISQEFPPLQALRPLLAAAKQKQKLLKQKINGVPVMDVAGTPEQQAEIRKKLADAMGGHATRLEAEMETLTRRCQRLTRLLLSEPVTLTELSRGEVEDITAVPANGDEPEVEMKTWTAQFTSPRGQELASLALHKLDWNYVCLVQTRPKPRAFFEDDQVENQVVSAQELDKEVNMRTVRLRRLRHGEGELLHPTPEALAGGQHGEEAAALDPRDERFHFSSIGGLYTGAFRLGRKHGHGKLYTNAGVYEGDFAADTRCGNGKMVFGKGTTCAGSFERPQRRYEHDGKLRGRAYASSLLNGDAFRDGVASGEKMHLVFPDGATYDGEMQDGVVTGLGRYVSSTGVVDEGEFLNGALHGALCRRRFPDGSYVEGAFVEGQPHGHCRQRGRHGDEYDGFFDGGARHGRATATFDGGKAKHVGFWHEDAMDGRGDFFYRLQDGDGAGADKSWDHWYEGAFMQNETRARHRHVDLRQSSRAAQSQQQPHGHQEQQRNGRHLPFTTNGKSREKMAFLTTVLPAQLDKLRRRTQLNAARRFTRERAYLEQCERSNLGLYYTLLDDFYEQWATRKQQDTQDAQMDADERQRVQEERQALQTLQERRERFRKERYDLSPRHKSLESFEQHLERVTLTEHVQLARAAAADLDDRTAQ